VISTQQPVWSLQRGCFVAHDCLEQSQTGTTPSLDYGAENIITVAYNNHYYKDVFENVASRNIITLKI